MKMTGNTTNYGEDIGILMLDTRFPRPRGDIGNAWSFDFPVRYKTVKGAFQEMIMKHEPEPQLIEPFIEAARELEREGVRAITTSCGFLAPFQKQLAAAVGIPVLASALLQAPLIHAMLPPTKRIGVFTERAVYMANATSNGVMVNRRHCGNRQGHEERRRLSQGLHRRWKRTGYGHPDRRRWWR